MRLRDLPFAYDHFQKPTLEEYLHQKVVDKTHDGTNDRLLPPNEIDAMALNEIAVANGQGFFFFLAHRNSWNKQNFDPASRGPAPDALGASIPSLVFMRFDWSEHARQQYQKSAQRCRYMACDYLLNPPYPSTPVYCIQVATEQRYPLFKTTHPSFILLRSNPLYFGSVSALGPIIGSPPRKRKGVDVHLRLGQANVWGRSASSSLQFRPYGHASLAELYHAIIAGCQDPSMTSNELFSMLPRPSAPEMGIAIGTDPSPTSSRLGIRYKRTSTVADDEEDIVSESSTLSGPD